MLLLVDPRLKQLATEAFSDNAKRSAMTDEEREEAARFYDAVAKQTVGTNAALAARYNNERARFLRGEGAHIAGTALGFAREETEGTNS